MPEPQTPATPPAGDPGASTPTPGGSPTTTPEPQAGDGDTQISLEEARKLRSEAQNLRKRMKAYEDAEAAAAAAQLTEVERLKKQQSDLQEQQEALAAELYEARVFQDVSRLASKFNFIVSADTLARMLLLDDDAIEFEGGKPQNIEKLLEKLAKAEPNLVKPAEQQQQGAPPIPGMSPDRAAYGRSSIQRPGTPTPGQRPNWDEVQWKH